MISPHHSQGRSALRLAGAVALVLAVLAAIVGPAQPTRAQAGSPTVVISQIYGAGGNAGATLRNDYVELFNRSATAVDLAGWSLQYASPTGTGNFGGNPVVTLNGTLQPGQYYLIQLAGGTTGAALPIADATGTINAGGAAGKFILANVATGLACNGGSAPCSPAQLAQIVDLVGFGTANFAETAAAPAASATTALFRAGAGCTDTDNNSADFAADPPAPRNSTAPLAPCAAQPAVGLSVSDVSAAEGNGGTTTFGFTVSLSAPAGLGGVTFDIATADNTATAADGDYVALSLSGQAIPAGSTSYSFAVTVNGDAAVEPSETFFVNVANVVGATVVDGQGQGTIQSDDVAAVAPAITTGPASQTINAGQTAALSVAATGTEPLTYAWYQGVSGTTTTPVGANSPSFTTPALSATTSYWVRVSNGAGSVDSATAIITVNPLISRIHAIQGSGATAAGGTFTVEAIVVGDYQDQGSGRLRGFFIQEEDADADADPATSEGIFVFCTSCPVAVSVGDKVSVTGASSEFFNMSQLSASSVASVSVISSGNPLPTPAALELPVPGVPGGDLAGAATAINAYFERAEGMLVTFPDTLSVREYFELARYGQVVLSEGGRPRTFTDASPPSAAGLVDHRIDLARRTIILDDTDNRQNRPSDAPNSAYYHPVPGLSTGNFFRGGDTITGLTGVLHWSFAGQNGTDAWRIRPVVEAYSYAFTPVNLRGPAPEVGGSLRVASYNVLNYFLTVDTTSSNDVGTCGPAGTADCRGADSAQEFERQRTKLLAALNGLDADVLGLIELENSPGVEPLADIVAGMPGYAYVDTGVSGSDAIRVGIIYKTGSVTPVGDHALLDAPAFVNPRSADQDRNRPALAQTFEENATGARFTVVVNHLKSKGSGCGAGDDDTAAGQGNCNLTRTLAARELARWLATDPTGSGDSDVLIIGDLNSYAKEDPIAALEAAGYANLVAQFGGPDAYSYVFDGQLGYLDHALSSASLTPQVAGVAEWHINADEIPLFDYNDDVRDVGERDAFEEESDALPLYAPDEFRTSDHDPVIVGLNLVNAPPVAVGDSYTTDEGRTLTVDAAAGVLANDVDPEAKPLTATLVRGPANGALTLNPDGSFTYQRNLNFFGVDSFTYSAGDGKTTSAETTVTIEVVPAGLYRARQVGERVWIERRVAATGDYDGDPVDGWALVGRTNGAADNGQLRGFFVEDGQPYVVVFNRSNNKGNRCILLTPRTLELVKKGQTRLMLNVNDNFTPCPAAPAAQLP